MPYTDDLLTGIATLLATSGVGVFDPTGVYTDPTVGIVFFNVPQSPASVITLSTYSLGDDATYGDSTVGLQVRSRHATANDPRPAQALDDGVFDALAGLHDLDLSTGVRLNWLQRTSSVPLGQDDNQRWMAASNYRLALYRPSPSRL